MKKPRWEESEKRREERRGEERRGEEKRREERREEKRGEERREEKKRKKIREEKESSQKTEDAGARTGCKVARHCVFPVICGSGASNTKVLSLPTRSRWDPVNSGSPMGCFSERTGPGYGPTIPEVSRYLAGPAFCRAVLSRCDEAHRLQLVMEQVLPPYIGKIMAAVQQPVNRDGLPSAKDECLRQRNARAGIEVAKLPSRHTRIICWAPSRRYLRPALQHPMPRHTACTIASDYHSTFMMPLGAWSFGVPALALLESSAQTGPILHHLGCLLTIDWLAQDHLRRGALLEESGPSLSWSLHGRYSLAPSKTHGTWIPIRICPPSLLPPPMPTSATLEEG